MKEYCFSQKGSAPFCDSFFVFFIHFMCFPDTFRHNNKKSNIFLQYVDVATSTPTWYCGKHDFCETASLKELSNLFPEFIKNYCISQKA